MIDFTSQEFLVLLAGSSGLIGAAVSVFNLVSTRLEKKASQDNTSRDAVETNLWKMLDAKSTEITLLKTEISLLEGDSLNRKKVTEIINIIRQMTKDIDSIKVVLLSNEDTQFFHDKLMSIKKGIAKLEEIL